MNAGHRRSPAYPKQRLVQFGYDQIILHKVRQIRGVEDGSIATPEILTSNDSIRSGSIHLTPKIYVIKNDFHFRES